ncbi:STAS domain-containing protein [Spirillospora sp. CA-255316]
MLPLDVTALPQDGRAVVRLSGELDIANGDDLRERLRAVRRSYGDHLVLDLTDLRFMDSHGLSIIIDCYKAVSEAGGGLVLAAPRPIVRRTLEITGLHRRITVTPTVEEALAARPDPARSHEAHPDPASPESTPAEAARSNGASACDETPPPTARTAHRPT